MKAAAIHFQDQEKQHAFYVNLRDLPLANEQSFFVGLYTDVLLVNEQDFFSSLFQRVARELFPLDSAVGRRLLRNGVDFQEAMQDLLYRLDHRLLLFIDDVETAPPNLVSALLAALAAVVTAVPEQARVKFVPVVCGAFSFEQLAEPARDFQKLSQLIWVDDLDKQERRALVKAACRHEGVTPGPMGIDTLLAQTGGDELLIKRLLHICFAQMQKNGQTELTPARVAEAVELFLSRPADDHLVENLKQIESDPQLLYTALRILEQGPTAVSRLSINHEALPTSLDLCGIFRVRDEQYEIKSELWGKLLQRNLDRVRIGGFYAVAGYWREAFRYLGQAVNEGQPGVRSELFTAVINAMHASENANGAYLNLAHGLAATYPESDLRLYAQTDTTLTCIYPPSETQTPEQVSLRDKERPEIQALHGADYSILSVNGESRLLLPLRIEPERSATVGLVSLGQLVSQNSPYQHREEVVQLVGFLRQAARVIKARGQYANLLQQAEERANKLNVLNSILTRILHQQERSEADVFKLALAGITSPSGLGFSRALLFMPDEQQHHLYGRFALGCLTRAEAERDWTLRSRQTLAELLESHLQKLPQEAPLAGRVQKLHFSLRQKESNLLTRVFNSGEPVLSSSHLPRSGLPSVLMQAIGAPREFALAPLVAGEQKLGVLYVDDKFTPSSIDNERFELLQTFTNQAALLLENARALATERRRTNSWRQLLRVEEAINHQVTKSVQTLLDEVVHGARALFEADNAVLYPFQYQKRLKPHARQLVYDVDHVTYEGTRYAVRPTRRPRSAQGVAAWVVQQGQLYVPHVPTAVSRSNGRQISDSTFIKREDVSSFIGVRLGTVDEPVGVLYLNWRRPHQLSKEQRTVLNVFANFVAVAIPGARSYERVQTDLLRRNQEMKGLNQIFYTTVYFRSEEEIEGAIRLALKTAHEHTEAPYLYLFRDEPHGAWRSYRLTEKGELVSEWRRRLPDGLVRRAFSRSRTLHQTISGQSRGDRLSQQLHPEAHSALAVPVKVTGHCLAVLYLESPQLEGFTREHQAFLESMASRLAISFEQVDRTQALQQLLKTSRQLTQQDDLKSALASLIKQAMSALRAVDAITLYYKDGETGQMMLGHMAGHQGQASVGEYFERPSPIIQRVWRSDIPLFVQNIVEKPLLSEAFLGPHEVKSVAAFPLRVGAERIGCMFFGYHFYHRFDPGEESVLNLFAQLAALAILRSSLFVEAERRRERLETVARITPIISANVDLDSIFTAVLKELGPAFPQAHNRCIAAYREETAEIVNTLDDLEFYHVDDPPLEGKYRTSLVQRRGIVGRVIETGVSANVADVRQDSDYIPSITSTRSELCVPIRIGDEVTYALVLESNSKQAFTADDQQLLETLADHVSIAVQNVEQFKLARARELSERTAMMATGLIHDINSAVASIPDLVDEIEEKVTRGADLSFPLADLRKSANVTEKISGRLKEFVVTGRYTPAPVDVDVLVKNAISISKPHEPVHVTTYPLVSENLPKILADMMWIELLLKNLLINAYSAIPEDRAGVVQLETEIEDAFVLLRVRDNGKGIPIHLQKDIFNFGVSTKVGGSNKMQGVGLYHCRLIAEAHEGTLTVDSEPGSDTVFTLSLPIFDPAKHIVDEGESDE